MRLLLQFGPIFFCIPYVMSMKTPSAFSRLEKVPNRKELRSMPQQQLEEFVSNAPQEWPIWHTALKRLKELEIKNELRKNSLEVSTMQVFAFQEIFDRPILQEIKARARGDMPEPS